MHLKNNLLQIIINSSQYPAFLDHMMKIFLKILQEGEPHFISEYNIQQVRKLILEMIHRLPNTEPLGPYVRPILSLVSKLLETDNEENVLVCLRIIIELHKQYKPTFNPEVSNFSFIYIFQVSVCIINSFLYSLVCVYRYNTFCNLSNQCIANYQRTCRRYSNRVLLYE